MTLEESIFAVFYCLYSVLLLFYVLNGERQESLKNLDQKKAKNEILKGELGRGTKKDEVMMMIDVDGGELARTSQGNVRRLADY